MTLMQNVAKAPCKGVSGALYKGFWVFLIGGIVGYFVEICWCFLKTGGIESKLGLLYGPFTLVYAFGALVLVAACHPFEKLGSKWIFIVCAVVGGTYEFLCSLFQEVFLGIISWDYPIFALSLTGRTSLIYMLFWGSLGLFLVRCVYPKISRLIDCLLEYNLRNFNLRLVTWILALLLCASISITWLAVERWTQRVAGAPPQNRYAAWLDATYPDEMIHDLFPVVKILDEGHKEG